MRKRLLCVFCAVAVGLSLTACWDHVEINTMLIVSGIGLDFDPAKDAYHAVVEFVNVEAEGGENIAAEMVEGEGDTVYNAIQNALLAAGGTMFGNHCKVIVVGEELARQGLNGVVEMVLRSPDFRKTVDILVAKGTTAADIFATETVVNEIVSYELSKILYNNEKTVKNTVSTSSYELHEAFGATCSASVLPAVYVKQDKDKRVLMVDGCAVLSDDQLQGFLTGEQSKLYQLLTRNKKNILLALKDDAAFDHPLDINLTNTRVTLSPQVGGGALTMAIHIKTKVTLEESVLLGTDPMDGDVRKQMEQRLGQLISAQITDLLAEVQTRYGADLFGFYLEFQDSYRQQWNDLRQDWRTHFRKMAFEVSTDARIAGSGLIGNYTTEGNDNAVALP